MSRYLLDTNHVSAIFKCQPSMISKLQAAVADGHEFAICVPSIGELWFIVFNSGRVAKNSVELGLVLSDFLQVGYDLPAAVEFGKIKSELRRSGRPIPGRRCTDRRDRAGRGVVLPTADSHFANVHDLTFENWLV